MSYRKKRSSSKKEPLEQQTTIPEVKYHNPGVSRDLSTAKLTSGLPYRKSNNGLVVGEDFSLTAIFF